MAQLIDEGPKKQGWIKAEKAMDSKKVEMALKNTFTEKMVKRINSFKPLDDRCSQNIKEKEALSECFKELCMDKIIYHRFSLFFESGSSTAFVARELGKSKRFRREVKIFKNKPEINLYTNNILAYLELWLNDGLPTTIIPRSSPGEKYGATYGILDELIDDEKAPDVSGNPLDQFAKDCIEKLKKSKDALPKNEKILLLTSISGVQFSNHHEIICEGYCISDLIEDKLNECFGFHVGSYKNKIYKRYLISTGFPMVMMLTKRKIDMPIDPEKCHFLFDKEVSWNNFLKNYPLAFCVGCKEAEIKEIKELLEGYDFETKPATDVRGTGVVFASNEHFRSKVFPIV